MAITLKYNTQFLRSTASQMRTYGYDHMDAIDRVTNLVHSLPDIWEGKSEEKLVAAFDEMQLSFDKFDDALEAYAKALETAAESMENADKQLKNKINSI